MADPPRSFDSAGLGSPFPGPADSIGFAGSLLELRRVAGFDSLSRFPVVAVEVAVIAVRTKRVQYVVAAEPHRPALPSALTCKTAFVAPETVFCAGDPREAPCDGAGDPWDLPDDAVSLLRHVQPGDHLLEMLSQRGELLGELIQRRRGRGSLSIRG